MAEILKITTPYLNNNKNNAPNPVHAARSVDPTQSPFALQDVQSVARPATQEEILQQNNTLIGRGDSDILTSLMKDPAAAVGFLKNIMVLQELVKLLPANNTTFTQEIEQMFAALMLSPEEIAAELQRQENNSTIFKGELFDFLREVLAGHDDAEMRQAIAGLLKSMNNLQGRQEALGAVANSLQYLSESIAPSKTLSEALGRLAAAFRQPDAPAHYGDLKREAMALLEEMETNLLYSPKLEKISAMTIYNLSRFNDNPDFFQEMVSNLFLLLSGRERSTFSRLIRDFHSDAGERQGAEQPEKSQIMDILTEIISKQAGEAKHSAATAGRLDKIIYSLLSSPCHFTPLLHFVVPVTHNGLNAFAEMWINPNGKEDRRGDGEEAKDCVHMLLAFDIEGIGQFEMELYAIDKKLELLLLCPSVYKDLFAKQAASFEKCLAGSPYRLDRVKVEKLSKPRSLMDVFKSLPYKRMGVNVKV